MKKSILLLLSLVLILSCVLMPVMAYEFSWNQAAVDWKLHENNSEIYMLPVREGEDSFAGWDRCPKRLRDPVSEDWVIETHIYDTDCPDGSGYHTGLMVYVDENNWIAWGIESGGRTVANGVLGGSFYDIESVLDGYEYIRITKTGDLYTFSCSPDRVHWVELAGRYDDIHHYLDGAQYGIFAKNWEPDVDFNATHYVMFDYFLEKENTP